MLRSSKLKCVRAAQSNAAPLRAAAAHNVQRLRVARATGGSARTPTTPRFSPFTHFSATINQNKHTAADNEAFIFSANQTSH